MTPQLVLASGSPRRSELLREAGYTFSVDPADVDESSYPSTLTPVEVAEWLAVAKARAVAARRPACLVLAADTVVDLAGVLLGKPNDADEARVMLGRLSGTIHSVTTGICLICIELGVEESGVRTSTVRMKSLADSEIARYIQSGLWEGKAGGYGLQDDDPFVTAVSGSASNIVGLPMELVRERLVAHGAFPAARR